MFEFRGDGHAQQAKVVDSPGDCLHYCVPGASMEWNRVLLHVLDAMLPSII